MLITNPIIQCFCHHSGGATGSDIAWAEVSAKYGVPCSRQYWHGSKTPHGNTQISKADYDEGWQKVLLANETLHRRPENHKDLLCRNWAPVKYSDVVFAIATLADSKTVNGGTGWAVQMAIDCGKPVYVFDQDKLLWYTWDYLDDCFTFISYTPSLAHYPQFAGIGTRQLNERGRRAINGVWQVTKFEIELLY